jgi:hypothetical protein
MDGLERDILRRYTKVICHLNYAFRGSRKLGLILGAGVSRDLDIPDWRKLLDEVEAQVKFDGKSGGGPESYRGEQLFQFFRMERFAVLEWASRNIAEAGINSDWRKIVSAILYRAFYEGGEIDPQKFTKAIDDHPYFREMAKIAGELDLVVSHNFDNALEWAISTEPTNGRPENQRYNAFWRPEPFLRQNMVNVYHPNGFSPIAGLKGSDSIILTESNFADHLANTNNAETNFLLSHLSYKTWLIIGHSLSDGTLKNALRLHANRRPGHVNYFVHWLPDGPCPLTSKQREAITEANFSTYNLITLFLTSKEIGVLLRLINKSREDLHSDISSEDLKSRYTYYICGAVSSGKSTILSHLRSVATVEEWPDRMPLAMNKPSTELSKEQKEDIDKKLEDAIWRKNEEIGKVQVGIVAVDRAPLDFIAFPESDAERPSEVAKARHDKVLRRLERNRFKDLWEGQVIVVQTDPAVLLERQIQRGRKPPDEDMKSGKALAYLERQQGLMMEVYEDAIKKGSTVRGDCCSIATCLQDVMRIIHFQKYEPFDFATRLETYLSETV